MESPYDEHKIWDISIKKDLERKLRLRKFLINFLPLCVPLGLGLYLYWSYLK